MRLIASLALSVVLLCAVPSHAAPISIEVLAESYNTKLSVSYMTVDWDEDGTRSVETFAREREKRGFKAISDQMSIQDLTETTKTWGATAKADAFSLDVSTTAYDPFEDSSLGFNSRAGASVDSSVSFRTLITGEVELELAAFVLEDALYYTHASMTLFDETLNQVLWSFGGGIIAADHSLPWEGPPWQMTMSLAQTLFLDASHVYNLTMHMDTNAWYDTEIAGLRVSGLQRQVPEPGTLLLLGTALIGARLYRRRIH